MSKLLSIAYVTLMWQGTLPYRVGTLVSPSMPQALTQKDKLFRAFIEMITSDNVVNRRLSYYAEKLYVTPKYLSHVCRCVSGQTAVAWINQMVTESVRYDLECSNLSIKEIAAKYDFSNLSFFGKYTKRQLGMSPREYRRQRERGKCQQRDVI